MNLYLKNTIVLWPIITYVQCTFYGQIETQVSTNSVVGTLQNVTITECVTSCLQSTSCNKSALKKKDGACLHLKKEKKQENNDSWLNVIVFEQRKLPISQYIQPNFSGQLGRNCLLCCLQNHLAQLIDVLSKRMSNTVRASINEFLKT